MAKQSESPKERINVTYKPATGGASEEVEIPFKLTVLGDFNPDAERVMLEERDMLSINKNNFNDVLKSQDLGLSVRVEDKLTSEPDAEIDVNLKFASMRDFSPESIVKQVPQLEKLMSLRESLVALKGPLGNVKSLRDAIANAITDEDERTRLLDELNISTTEKD